MILNCIFFFKIVFFWIAISIIKRRLRFGIKSIEILTMKLERIQKIQTVNKKKLVIF